jgi:hypothetical protein
MQGVLPENEIGDLVTRLSGVVEEGDHLEIDWWHAYQTDRQKTSALDLDAAVKSALGQLPAEAQLGIGWARTVAVALGADGYVRVHYRKGAPETK